MNATATLLRSFDLITRELKLAEDVVRDARVADADRRELRQRIDRIFDDCEQINTWSGEPRLEEPRN